ncbi:MAG: class Ib ribonucleoside-diphosphate reductase assembly flavoprotein NrdI [Aerococcus sp.]|nr:class Ib ribonucleoside-diphosphate reductase assembly flavoprotein NrdI [Aerococcus sp.]
MLIVYMSVVGNTRKFVHKLEQPLLEITTENCFTEVDEPYLMVVPTYDIYTTDIMNDFIETGENQSYCRGVIGGGNWNFGKDLFCYTAQDIALDYDVPLLHCFEFMGSKNDVKKVKEIVEAIENTNSIQSTH